MEENSEKEDGEKDTQLADFDLGMGDEVSDEKYFALVQEVSELTAKVAEYREKGPREFAALVERSLSAFRKLPVVDREAAHASANEANDVPELTTQRVGLTKRLEAAIGTLLTLSEEVKDCSKRLDNMIAILT